MREKGYGVHIMSPETSTHEKALRINLDATKHGTFAEIFGF
jgi:hypothetical protein